MFCARQGCFFIPNPVVALFLFFLKPVLDHPHVPVVLVLECLDFAGYPVQVTLGIPVAALVLRQVVEILGQLRQALVFVVVPVFVNAIQVLFQDGQLM